MAEHFIKHSYKEEIIVPYVAFYNNFAFLTDSDEEKFVVTADNQRCKIVEYHIKNALELGEDIQRIYGLDVLAFLNRWYEASEKRMTSLDMIILKLHKVL